MTASRIELADRAEEEAAAMSLRATKNTMELVDAWMFYCDHFDGAARERLQSIYSEELTRYVPLARAG